MKTRQGRNTALFIGLLLLAGVCNVFSRSDKPSQEKLCAELQRRGCDIGRTTYAKYEAGELNIRASVLVELTKIYQCTYDEFFAGLG